MGTSSYQSLSEAPISYELKDLRPSQASVKKEEEKGSTFLDIVEAVVNVEQPMKSSGDLIHWSLFAQVHHKHEVILSFHMDSLFLRWFYPQ